MAIIAAKPKKIEPRWKRLGGGAETTTVIGITISTTGTSRSGRANERPAPISGRWPFSASEDSRPRISRHQFYATDFAEGGFVFTPSGLRVRDCASGLGRPCRAWHCCEVNSEWASSRWQIPPRIACVHAGRAPAQWEQCARWCGICGTPTFRPAYPVKTHR